jgi:hypothetical protein
MSDIVPNWSLFLMNELISPEFLLILELLLEIKKQLE